MNSFDSGVDAAMRRTFLAIATGLLVLVAPPFGVLTIGYAAAQATNGGDMELEFWNSIKNSSNPADYQAYLDTYPAGHFAALAKVRVRQAGAASAPPPAAEHVPAVAKVGSNSISFGNGDSYEGDLRHGKPNGHGTYFFASGGREEGEFRDGKLNGQGTYIFPSGDRFEGQYRNDMPISGIYIKPDGRRFKAEINGDNIVSGAQLP